MVRTEHGQRTGRLLILAGCLGCLAAGGCVEKQLEADPARVLNRWSRPLTVAVAPALNFSGTSDFDPNRVADLMASELGHVDGVNVIPVSRVLAVLAGQGRREVESPQHALEIVERVGADAVLVFAVTEYDPYDPPIVGLTAQLYGRIPGRALDGGMDPVLVSRQAWAAEGSPEQWSGTSPVAQTQRVFNAAHDYVVQETQRFARWRGERHSAYGARLYLVSQEHYLRYCCWEIVEDLFAPDVDPEPAASMHGEVNAR